jgi:NADPH-dependent glutamate synthase beta subunit-like oxidoreductase/NAD(P)H-flavin reductase
MAPTSGLGIDFIDLIDDSGPGLARLDAQFIDFLATVDVDGPALVQQLLALRLQKASDVSSELLISLARALEKFLVQIFPLTDTAHLHAENKRLLRLKWKFVKRKGVLLYPLADLLDFDGLAAETTLKNLIQEALKPDEPSEGLPLSDVDFGRAIEIWQSDAQEESSTAQSALTFAAKFSAWAAQHPLGRARSTEAWLRQLEIQSKSGGFSDGSDTCHFEIKPIRFRARHGFDLTDVPATGNVGALQALDQADYCLKCHKTGTDSCSKGITNAANGCPLNQKISEFLSLRADGFLIAALAMIVRDNPMLAATGHRICNDCSLACVFQQQTPVDIPMAETQVLREVLNQPWGFEVYALLTRWNPLNTQVPKPLADTGRTVLVAGMGPAGFTLAHQLLQLGHSVVGVDALKIQALPQALQTIIESNRPILDINQWFEALSVRPAYGFGGVAEYGITSRWEKNFLTVIRLLLTRRSGFALLGDTRLGSSLTITQAFDAGFSHVACALGAGAPRLPKLAENALPKGVKTASDFLMALHSAGARQASATTNLQIRLPIIVVGGGLTGVDTTTEALAYYPVQVARYAAQWRNLSATLQTQFLAALEPQDHEVHHEFLAHASAFAANPSQAHQLIQSLGGATLIYRRKITQSPAFTLNRDELTKALIEGIKIIEEINPIGYQLDGYGALKGLRVVALQENGAPTIERVLPAKTVIYAIGTQPNEVIISEDPSTFGQPPEILEGETFRMATLPDGRWVSRVGDLHPRFAGSVVKAMASAKAAAPLINTSLMSVTPRYDFKDLARSLKNAHTATVTKIIHHAPGIAEIYVHAPAAAKAFRPGQFFRLQSIHDDSIEPLAMTGASADPIHGELSMVVLASGTSSLRSMRLAVGQQISLMGPTGQASDLPHNKKVVLVGGGLGNAVLFSIGKAMRAQGCEVIYFAGYRQTADVVTRERIEQAADKIIWCCDQALLPTTRPNDLSFHGNILEALTAHRALLTNTDHLLTIGSDRMMAAIAHARRTDMADSLGKIPLAIGSINSPMQCMMKAICGQCLQTHRDPVTGALSYVFSCQQQDQLLDCVDFSALKARLNQNHLQEQLSKISELHRL